MTHDATWLPAGSSLAQYGETPRDTVVVLEDFEDLANCTGIVPTGFAHDGSQAGLWHSGPEPFGMTVSLATGHPSPAWSSGSGRN